MYKIVTNKIRCKFCGDVIESRSVHDFVQCRCGKCSTDGGHEYAQRSFATDHPEDTYEDLSTYLDTETGKLVDARGVDVKNIPVKAAKLETAPDLPAVEAELTPDISKVIEEQSDEPEKPFEPPIEATVIKQHWTKEEREAYIREKKGKKN